MRRGGSFCQMESASLRSDRKDDLLSRVHAGIARKGEGVKSQYCLCFERLGLADENLDGYRRQLKMEGSVPSISKSTFQGIQDLDSERAY